MIEISGWYDTNEGRELDLIISGLKKPKSIKDLDLINMNLNKRIKNTLNSINL
jgi:hypothetical protein